MQPQPQPWRLAGATATRRAGLPRRAHLTLALLAALALASPGGPRGADLYRWVDETGTTVYSQKPPPAATPATRIRPDKAPTAPPPAAPAAPEDSGGPAGQEADRRDDPARQAEEASKKAAEQAARKVNCDTARTNLETLKNHGRGRIRTPDGQARFLSRDELATMQEEAQRQIRDNCD